MSKAPTVEQKEAARRVDNARGWLKLSRRERRRRGMRMTRAQIERVLRVSEERAGGEAA